MICKHCEREISQSGYTPGRWIDHLHFLACGQVEGRPIYHEPISDDEVVAGLRLIVEDLR